MGTIDAIEHDPAGLKCNQTQSMDQNNQLFVKEQLFILLCHQTWPGKSSVNGGFFWLGKSSITGGLFIATFSFCELENRHFRAT
jgi:hypothetical protein